MATSTTMIDGMFALYSAPFNLDLLTLTLMQLFYTICMHGLLDPHIYVHRYWCMWHAKSKVAKLMISLNFTCLATTFSHNKDRGHLQEQSLFACTSVVYTSAESL